jgi:hypothetical protein
MSGAHSYPTLLTLMSGAHSYPTLLTLMSGAHNLMYASLVSVLEAYVTNPITAEPWWKREHRANHNQWG